MEWMLQPAAWAGLTVLVFLEVVLGTHNLRFVQLLVAKLPTEQQARAQATGLGLALLLRLGLLGLVVWLLTLSVPLFQVGVWGPSLRDLLLLCGGVFLIVSATLELRRHLEEPANLAPPRGPPLFGLVVAQVVLVNTLFSLDAILVAVGLVSSLSLMVLAVLLATVLLLIAAAPLQRLLQARPTIRVLCLAFLLLIGFVLVAESLGFRVPKGYLYAVIAFSVLTDLVNQRILHRHRQRQSVLPWRTRAAEAMLGLLRGHPAAAPLPPDQPAETPESRHDREFAQQERHMVSGVLSLVDRSVQSIMTPRTDISWVNLHDDPAVIRKHLTEAPHSFFPVCRGTLDEVDGIGRARDLLADILTVGRIRPESLRPPLIVHESISMPNLMETLKQSRGQLVLITDEFGAIEGLVTPIDLFEAIAGEFPDEDELPDVITEGDNRWRANGAADLHHLEQLLNTTGLVDEHYATLGGYLLARFDQLPNPGQVYETPDGSLRFEVLDVQGRRITTVRITRQAAATPSA